MQIHLNLIINIADSEQSSQTPAIAIADSEQSSALAINRKLNQFHSCNFHLALHGRDGQ